MKKNAMSMNILVDSSGSMESIAKDMAGSLNQLVDDNRDLDATVTYSTFSDCYRPVFSEMPVKDVRQFRIKPSGSTALIESACKMIDEVGMRLAAKPESERPEKVMFVIVTDADTYLKLVDKCKIVFSQSDSKIHSFPTLSHTAWHASNAVIIDDPSNERNYWVYAAGAGASRWEEFHADRIMAIGWDFTGDLKKYRSRDEIRETMKHINGDGSDYTMVTCALWDFCHEIHVDDVIIVKNGKHEIIGRGIVESDYIFDSKRESFHHVRKVKWTHKGNWKVTRNLPIKTLTRYTSYTEAIQEMNEFFDESEIDPIVLPITIRPIEPYTRTIVKSPRRYPLKNARGVVKNSVSNRSY